MSGAGELLDRRLTYGVIFALLLQMATGLIWAGGAAARLNALERAQIVNRDDHVRLAQMETRLDLIADQLDRIEARLEAGNE